MDEENLEVKEFNIILNFELRIFGEGLEKKTLQSSCKFSTE